MTYCLGIVTKLGLVMASDSRTNAGYDQVNICRKMHTFAMPGERVFIILTSGSLSLTQSVITLIRRDFDSGRGLAAAPTMYDAARVIGEQVRKVSELDRTALERDDYRFNINLLLGGQIKGEPHGLILIDRGIRYDQTTLEEAAKYAMLSLDSTMKSNVTVGPPIDLLAYSTDELEITRHRRFNEDDPDLGKIRLRWQQALRQAVLRLPDIRFRKHVGVGQSPTDDSIQLVEGAPEAQPEFQK
jgi:putative proteasome-type protease